MPTRTTLRLKDEFENAEREFNKLQEVYGSYPTPTEEDQIKSAKAKLDIKKAEYLDALGQEVPLKGERVVREPKVAIQGGNPWIRFSPTLPPAPPAHETVLVAGYFKSDTNKLYYYTGEYNGTTWHINTSFLNEINAVFIVTHWQRINKNLY